MKKVYFFGIQYYNSEHLELSDVSSITHETVRVISKDYDSAEDAHDALADAMYNELETLKLQNTELYQFYAVSFKRDSFQYDFPSSIKIVKSPSIDSHVEFPIVHGKILERDDIAPESSHCDEYKSLMIH